MHNFAAKFAKNLDICKKFAGNLVNELGNMPRRGVVPRFSDLEIVALCITSEFLSIDSENYLFQRILSECKQDIPNLISRRQYNDRRRYTAQLASKIREQVANFVDGGEEFLCIDSKPIPVCIIARSKRCQLGRKDYTTAPSYGCCASQSMYYYGYKLHAVDMNPES